MLLLGSEKRFVGYTVINLVNMPSASSWRIKFREFRPYVREWQFIMNDFFRAIDWVILIFNENKGFRL